ncbi:MAG: hypothetical protein R3Y52_00435 [Psittacicella sp.]
MKENIPSYKQNDINAGMPILDISKKISKYEFLPIWFWYTPVFIDMILQGFKYFNWKLPLIANPTIKLSGIVGESKTEILDLAGPTAQKKISPYITFTKDTNNINDLLNRILPKIGEKGLSLPYVIKPDEGCRGVAVKVLHNLDEIKEYLKTFPIGFDFMIQRLIKFPAEAGIFYTRIPGQEKGSIISFTLKYKPFIIGDGIKTLKELILADERAGKLTDIYFPKFENKLDLIIPKDTQFPLSFVGNHGRGAIFKNGSQFITEELKEAMDKVLKDVKGFYYGRLDIKFNDINTFMKGKDFEIIEINGASSESIHIWDNTTKFKDMFKALFKQYRILFKIGNAQRKLGVKSPKLSYLIKEWRREKALVKNYPTED